MTDLRRMRFLMNRLPMACLRVERALSKATKCTQMITGMPGGGAYGDRIADGAMLYAEAKATRDGIRRELKEMRRELKGEIERLDDPLERTVMEMRYLDGRSVREIAYSLNYSERWIFYRLSEAEGKIEAGA